MPFSKKKNQTMSFFICQRSLWGQTDSNYDIASCIDNRDIFFPQSLLYVERVVVVFANSYERNTVSTPLNYVSLLWNIRIFAPLFVGGVKMCQWHITLAGATYAWITMYTKYYALLSTWFCQTALGNGYACILTFQEPGKYVVLFVTKWLYCSTVVKT